MSHSIKYRFNKHFVVFQRFIRLVSIVIFISIVVSCSTKRTCERKYLKYSDSSVRVTNTVTIIHDTLINIKLKGDTVYKVIFPSNGEISELTTPLACSFAWIANGKLNHRLQQKDTVIPASIKNAVRSTNTTTNEFRNATKVIKTNQLTSWQWFQIYMGRSFAALIVLSTVWFFMKKSQI
jgi:hypothetical protein